MYYFIIAQKLYAEWVGKLCSDTLIIASVKVFVKMEILKAV